MYRSLAEQLVDPERPGSFNQALMELGATVCTAKAPSCESCPLQSCCNAYKEVQQFKLSNQQSLTGKRQKSSKKETSQPCKVCGDVFGTPTQEVTKYPQKTKKNAPREETVGVTLLEHLNKGEAKYLLVQRPETGLLASLWEFPQIPLSAEEQEDEHDASFSDTTRASLDAYIADHLGLRRLVVQQRVHIGTVTHLFSHIKQTLSVEWMQVSKFDSEAVEQKMRWVTEAELTEAAISKGVQKCFDLLTKFKKPSKSKSSKASKSIDQKQKSILSFFKK